MSWAATAIAGTGAVMSYVGSQNAASAASGAANAQAGMAEQVRADILGQAKQNEARAMSLAEASPQELNSLGQSYDAAGKQLAREERLMAAIDPSLMEASKQALGLLRGETADVNRPMTMMRQKQRESMVNSLRAKYGPGAEESSIGQRMLSQFDMETNSLFAQNQQQSLSQLFGIATSGAPGSNLQRSISGLQEVGQGYSAITNRKLNAEMNLGGQTLNALAGTSSAMIDSAGAQYASDALSARGLSSLGNNLMNAGAMVGMYGNKTEAPAANTYNFAGKFGSGVTEGGSVGGFGSNRRIGQGMVE